MAAALPYAILLVCVVGVGLIFKIHRVRGKIVLTEDQRARLVELAGHSLESGDVPVGAVLIYKGKTIGEGYNTELRNAKAGEHAEINAISSAITSLGMDEFSRLDRRSLVLISTFEPCLMCAGAFVNYNIQHVYFMMEKDLQYLVKEGALFSRYLIRRRQTRDKGEQEALFEKHPGYPGRTGRSS